MILKSHFYFVLQHLFIILTFLIFMFCLTAAVENGDSFFQGTCIVMLNFLIFSLFTIFRSASNPMMGMAQRCSLALKMRTNTMGWRPSFPLAHMVLHLFLITLDWLTEMESISPQLPVLQDENLLWLPWCHFQTSPEFLVLLLESLAWSKTFKMFCNGWKLDENSHEFERLVISFEDFHGCYCSLPG